MGDRSMKVPAEQDWAGYVVRLPAQYTYGIIIGRNDTATSVGRKSRSNSLSTIHEDSSESMPQCCWEVWGGIFHSWHPHFKTKYLLHSDDLYGNFLYCTKPSLESTKDKRCSM